MNQKQNPILAGLATEIWAMDSRSLEAFFVQIAEAQFPPAEPAAFMDDDEDMPMRGKKSRMTMEGGVATIPISGILMKRVPRVFRYWGIDATAYSDVEADLAQAVGDQSIQEIRLKIESPGGQVSGVKEASDAIFAARKEKRVTAHIEDIGASGAYWLAAQAERVSATPNAQVGSIGVYSVYIDSSAAAEKEGVKVHVLSSGAHKGMGVPGAPITEEQLVAMREVIEGMALNFVRDVARGRAMGTEQIAAWATGRVWLASDAKHMGLVDGIGLSMDSTRRPVVGRPLKVTVWNQEDRV